MNRGRKQLKSRRIVFVALMLAFTFLGANIKVPGFPSVALDGLPAYFTGLFFGCTQGALVGAVGHILTAQLAGFPLGLPIHCIIAIMMGISVWVFAWIAKKSHIVVAIAVAILFNGILMPLSLAILPSFPLQMAWGFVPVLVMVSSINVLLATAIYRLIKKTEIAKKMNPYV